MAVPFDLDTLRVTGLPTPVLEPVYTSTAGQSRYSVSDSGTILYAVGGGADPTLVRVERGGGRVPLHSHADRYHYPRLSPAGDFLAVTIHSEPGSVHGIWLIDIARDTRRLLTLDGNNNFPVWTPDGRRMTFARSSVEGGLDIYWQRVDGSPEAEPLVTGPTFDIPRSWTSAGQLLAFERGDSQDKDIWVLPVDGEPSVLLASPFSEREPAFSPDGTRLAYVSNESGQDEVYVLTYPELVEKVIVSPEGGQEPLWSRDGRVLFYRNLSVDKLFAVPFEPGAALAPGPRETVMTGRFDTYLSGGPSYDVSADESFFVMLAIDDDSGGTNTRELRLVLNWDHELVDTVPPD